MAEFISLTKLKRTMTYWEKQCSDRAKSNERYFRKESDYLRETQAKIGTLTNLGKCLSDHPLSDTWWPIYVSQDTLFFFMIYTVGYLHLCPYTLRILKSSIKMRVYCCPQKWLLLSPSFSMKRLDLLILLRLYIHSMLSPPTGERDVLSFSLIHWNVWC